MKKIYLQGSVKKGADGYYEILASTSAIDRQGDSIDQNGWDLTNFKSNPVLLWAHDYSEFPIGKVVDIGVVDGALKAKFEFAPAEANPKAAQIQKLYEGGYVNASSVGLIPKERSGHIITKAELLELSLVPVPANQEALRMAVANKSLDLSEIEKDFEKGAVANEVDAQEAWEKKYENWKKLSEVMGALWNVYFDEKTAVEEFPKLLNETADLFKGIADGLEDPEEDSEKFSDGVAKAISEENTLKFLEATVGKSGKKLSKKTLEKIDASIEAAKNVVSVLENLKSENDQTESTEVADSGAEKEVEANAEVVEVPLEDFIKSIQSHVRISDKANEQSNILINGFLANRKK